MTTRSNKNYQSNAGIVDQNAPIPQNLEQTSPNPNPSVNHESVPMWAKALVESIQGLKGQFEHLNAEIQKLKSTKNPKLEGSTSKEFSDDTPIGNPRNRPPRALENPQNNRNDPPIKVVKSMCQCFKEVMIPRITLIGNPMWIASSVGMIFQRIGN